MAVAVSILGVVVALIGLAGIVQPKVLTSLVECVDGRTRFRAAVIVRLVLGSVMLAVAPSCRIPLAVQIVGGLAILAAVVLLFVGQKRLDEFIAWWLQRLHLVRVSAVFAIALGALLTYSGA